MHRALARTRDCLEALHGLEAKDVSGIGFEPGMHLPQSFRSVAIALLDRGEAEVRPVSKNGSILSAPTIGGAWQRGSVVSSQIDVAEILFGVGVVIGKG